MRSDTTHKFLSGMSGTKQRPVEEIYVVGITRWLFGIFVAASLAVIFLLNSTTNAELKLLVNQFPEVSGAFKSTFIHTYRMGMTLALFVVDIIVVGPFAYLGYFSEHIKPRPGRFVNSVSFFDLGILAALIYTITIGCMNFVITNSVAESPRDVNVNAIVVLLGAAFLAWALLLLAKIYSYSRDQRRELKKYAIRLY